MRLPLRGVIPLLITLSVLHANAAPPTLNYQGRMTASGHGFTGEGHFKFVLLNREGQGMWSNDGSSGTNEPAVSASVEVNNGLFTIELGDTSLPGMAAISPLAFHQSGLMLRTWFSTNSMTFECLSPDTKIRPPDFAHMNTGRMVVVDANGSADFNNLPDAIAAVGADTNYDGVLVMPGRYELSEPLPLDVNRPFLITGINPSLTTLVNTNGPALLLRKPIAVAKLTVVGNPAVSDAGATDVYCLMAEHSVFTPYSGGGPAVECHGTGSLDFRRECAIGGGSGPGLRLGGNVRIGAGDSQFQDVELIDSTWANESHVFDRCGFMAHSPAESSLTVRGGSGGADFRNCTFAGAVVFTNTGVAAKLDGCRIDGGLVFDGVTNTSGYAAEVCNTLLERNGIALRGGMGAWWFKNVTVTLTNNTALIVNDVAGQADFLDCMLQTANSGTAVQITESAAVSDHSVRVSFDGCRIVSFINGPWQTNDALVVSDADPSGAFPQVFIERSLVGAIRYGVHSDGGAVVIMQSRVSGGLSAVTCTNAVDCWIESSRLESGEGDRNLSGPPSDIISITGQRAAARLVIYHSTSGRAGGRPGRGLYADLNHEGQVLVVGSVLAGLGNGSGIECAVRNLSVFDSIVAGGEQAPSVLIKGGNTVASLQATRLYSAGVENTNDIVVLVGDGEGATAPTPQIVGCTITTASTNEVNAIGLAGGATTGSVLLVSTTMSKPLSDRIGLIAPSNTMSYGNHVFPELR